VKGECVLTCSQVAAAVCNSPQPALAAAIRQRYGNEFPDEGRLLVVVLTVCLMFWAKIRSQPAISTIVDWAYWFCGLFFWIGWSVGCSSGQNMLSQVPSSARLLVSLWHAVPDLDRSLGVFLTAL